MIPVFELSESAHALDRAATVIGYATLHNLNFENNVKFNYAFCASGYIGYNRTINNELNDDLEESVCGVNGGIISVFAWRYREKPRKILFRIVEI
jgi:hypothetical protein